MKLKFTKMHGAGNDFVVLDATRTHINLTAQQWRAVADRHFGVGADQILVVGPSQRPDVDFSYRIFNADGGEVEQCGNGARAFVRFVHDHGLSPKRTLRVETLSGIIEPSLEADGNVRVDMGAPQFDPEQVPFNTRGLSPLREGQADLWPVEVNGHSVTVAVLSMGNPHAVQIVDDCEAAPVADEGPSLEHHARFPKRVNAGYMQIVNRHDIRLRVWERGAGETLACGTGACAAVVSGILRGHLDSPVTVHTHGGDLNISWNGNTAPVVLCGPAVSVFEGEIEI